MIILPPLLAQAEHNASDKMFYGIIIIQWILPLISIAFWILLAVCIWRAAKYFGNAVNEQKLLRMEMGKLAEEVHLLRQEMEGDNRQTSSTDSK